MPDFVVSIGDEEDYMQHNQDLMQVKEREH